MKKVNHFTHRPRVGNVKSKISSKKNEFIMKHTENGVKYLMRSIIKQRTIHNLIDNSKFKFRSPFPVSTLTNPIQAVILLSYFTKIPLDVEHR